MHPHRRTGVYSAKNTPEQPGGGYPLEESSFKGPLDFLEAPTYTGILFPVPLISAPKDFARYKLVFLRRFLHILDSIFFKTKIHNSDQLLSLPGNLNEGDLLCEGECFLPFSWVQGAIYD